MPSKTKSENYDALGGIFDFIFKESKKPPDKRKPIIPTGVAGDTMLADAIVSALEMPGVFISDTVVKEYNSALDVDLGSIQFDDDGPGHKIKISTTSLIDFVKDPAGYIDKATQRAKADRAAGRAKFLRETMQDFMTTAWAHKYGNREAQAASIASSLAHEKKAEAYQVSRAIGEHMVVKSREAKISSVDYMAKRSIELLGRRTFGTSWNSMSDKDKGEFFQVISNGDVEKVNINDPEKLGKIGTAVDQADIQRYLARRFGSQQAIKFARATRNAKNGKIDIADPDLYKDLENDNLTGRIQALSTAAPGSSQEDERRIYEKTKYLINMNNQEIIKGIQDIKSELSRTTDPARKKELKAQLKDSTAALTLLTSNTIMGRIGTWEGYLGSIKGVWLGENGGNLLPAILNGDFFDGRKNNVGNPVEEKSIGGVKIYVAKRLKNSANKERTVLNAYNKMGESLYYLTPRSIFRTLFYNGEGFAALLSHRLDSLNAMSGSLTASGLSYDALSKSINTLSGKDLDNFISRALQTASGRMSPADYKRLKGLLGGSKSLKRMTDLFSMPSKIQGYLKGLVEKRVRKLRARFARFLLKNKSLRKWLVKTGAIKFLGKWIAKGGIQVLIKSLVTAVVGALGVATTGVGGALISALTWVATDIALKLIKWSLEIGKYAILGIIGLFFLLSASGGSATRKFNQTNYTYSNVAPGDVLICDAYGGYSIEEPDPWDPGYETKCVGGDESVQEIYSRVAKDMGLSTSLELVNCPGHSMCASIDWAWCYSAGSIFCKADELAGQSCPVLERLFVHELLHQVQSRNNGGIYGTLLREWGADYLSGNGGGYSFNTGSGCIRATETPMFSSCDEATLTAIAQSEGWAYETDCRRALSNYITGFCSR